jgi:hypothetical protein
VVGLGWCDGSGDPPGAFCSGSAFVSAVFPRTQLMVVGGYIGVNRLAPAATLGGDDGDLWDALLLDHVMWWAV